MYWVLCMNVFCFLILLSWLINQSLLIIKRVILTRFSQNISPKHCGRFAQKSFGKSFSGILARPRNFNPFSLFHPFPAELKLHFCINSHKHINNSHKHITRTFLKNPPNLDNVINQSKSQYALLTVSGWQQTCQKGNSIDILQHTSLVTEKEI